MFIQGSPSKAEVIDVSSVDATGNWYVIRVGNSGDVKVDYKDGGTAVVLENCANGSWEPGVITKIYNADTTASGIVAYSQ